MAILRRIVQNNKRSCYFYNGSFVFSTILCVSCMQLIALFFFVLKFFICKYVKYFVKILLLEYLNVKMVVKIMKII
jgi:hypothetical protein